MFPSLLTGDFTGWCFSLRRLDLFRAPGALDGVRLPILAWAGTKDEITPPAQVEFLNDVIEAPTPVEVHIVEGAGHFTFMNHPPPQTTDSAPESRRIPC